MTTRFGDRFEDILNPFDARRTRSLSLFDARHRFVVSYYYELPVPKYSGFTGKVLNGWAVSGITQFQAGFPIHLQSFDDNELTSSIDFASAGEPDQIAPFHKIDPRSNPNNYAFDQNSFTSNASDPTAPPCSAGATFNCYQPSLFGRFGTAQQTAGAFELTAAEREQSRRARKLITGASVLAAATVARCACAAG